MQFRLFKLRFRRRMRKSARQVEDLGRITEVGLERHFFKRLSNLGKSWRFIATWIGLIVLVLIYQMAQIAGLSSHYQTQRPVAGGSYTEGILGRFTNANPLFAVTEVVSSVSKLVFAGLFTYDSHNKLTGDLASSYDVDDKGTSYTIHLRPDLHWQDGQRLTADDVVFTYTTMQNPDVQSPFAKSWQGIKITKRDAYTVVFTLNNPLTAFPYNLTNGIVPQHLLKKYAASELRSIDFNTLHPVGAGPFAWSALQVKNTDPTNKQVLLALTPFAGYHGGRPKLDSFVVEAFSNQDNMMAAFKHQQLNGLVGLDTMPSALQHQHGLQQNSLILTAANMTFFNTAKALMSDPKVRQALVAGVDTTAIIKKLGYTTRPVNEPFLTGQLGYDKTLTQAGYNPAAAKTALDQAGWVMGKDMVRAKAGQKLNFTLYALDTAENHRVTGMLRQQWQEIGANADIHLLNADELQNTIVARDYDALLYGISIGVDPDVYVYWDSTQNDPRSNRLNFSQYKSTTADSALEDGRTRRDPVLRVIKYKPFLQAWQQDAPGFGLYQPRFLYLTNEKVYGLDAATINSGVDRLNNVANWEVRTAKVTND